MLTSDRTSPPLARDGIYVEVRDRIVSNAIPEGTRLSAADLQELFPVSRKPIREAVNRLVGEGFLVMTETRRSVVPRITAEYVAEHQMVAQALYAGILVRRVVPLLTNADERWFRLALDEYSHARSVDDMNAAAAAFEDLLLPFATRWGNRALLDMQRPAVRHLRRALASRLTIDNGRRIEAGAHRAHAAMLDRDAIALEQAIADILGPGIDAIMAGLPPRSLTSTGAVRAALATKAEIGAAPLLRDYAYNKLMDAILDGTLLPGEILDDREVSTWLGVAKGTLREVYARLADIGVVEVIPKRFTRVRPANSDVFNQYLFVSELLRRHTVQTQVSEASNEDIAAIQQSFLEVRSSADSDDLQRHTRALREYFEKIDSLTHNERIIAMSSSLDRRLNGYLTSPESLPNTRKVIDILERLTTQIIARDATVAASTLTELMLPTIDYFLSHVRPADTEIDLDVAHHVERYTSH